MNSIPWINTVVDTPIEFAKIPAIKFPNERGKSANIRTPITLPRICSTESIIKSVETITIEMELVMPTANRQIEDKENILTNESNTNVNPHPIDE